MLDPGDQKRLFEFIGYGRLNAPVWFLGMEEGGGGEERIRLQAKFDPVEDLRDAHMKLNILIHHEGKRKLQPQWRSMSEFMLRLGGLTEQTTEDRRNYQVEKLGRTNGDTLLLELLPIPKRSIDTWGYEDLFPMYPDKRSYEVEQLPLRKQMISNLIGQHRPKLVVAYGKDYWGHYKELITPAQFQDVNGFPVGQNSDTTMILTHFWTSRSMNNRMIPLVDTAIAVCGESLRNLEGTG